MKTLMLILALVATVDLEKAIVLISGASTMEELSQEEIDRFQTLSDNPVDINHASRGRLLSSGLFSAYQVASIIDYRSRTGDILSYAELALVDGFSAPLAHALEHFTVLKSTAAPGTVHDLRYRHTLTAMSKASSSSDPSWRAVYQGSLGQTAAIFLNSTGTASAVWYGRRVLGKVIAGNFNARFGQGLLQWSGFAMAQYSSLQSFRRNASGLSPTSSSSPQLTGVAADWNIGSWTLATAFALEEPHGIMNISRNWKNVSAGLTVNGSGCSLDCSFPLPDTSVSGEIACSWDGKVSALVNSMYTPVYGSRIALAIRYLGMSGNEWSGIAAGFGNDKVTAILDAGVKLKSPDSRQIKALFTWTQDFHAGGWTLVPLLRVGLRWRPAEKHPLRAEFRAVTSASAGRWGLNMRYDFVFCDGPANLAYLEASYSGGSLSAFARAGLFHIDRWDSRIYVYERDAPGSFNVPAYYGRGWNASLYGGWHINGRHSLWLRLDSVSYPWNPVSKAGKASVRIQYRWKV